jgi:hypothetical protein
MGKINGAKKGKQFERDVANALGHIFPDAQRMLEYQASNVVGVDLENTGEFDIQCKRNAGYAPVGKITEIQVRSPERTPVLVTKGNHVPAMVILPFDRFIRLLERIPDIAQRDNLMTSIRDNENKYSIAHDESIPTEAIEVKTKEPRDTIQLSAEMYSVPAKEEGHLPYEDAVQELQELFAVPVICQEHVPANKVLVQFEETNGDYLHAFFFCQWMRASGSSRLAAAVAKWMQNNEGTIRQISVRPKTCHEIFHPAASEVENPQDIVEEVQPAASYSFI